MKLNLFLPVFAYAHDPEAMGFCNDKMPGVYPDVKDCAAFFFCWQEEEMIGDKIYCEPGKVFNERLIECTDPFCLPYDSECYEPCYICGDKTQEEVWEECYNKQ